jgi:hypothetical protein
MSVVVPDVSPAGDAPARNYPTLAFEPYIPAATALRELTVLPVGVGAVLGMIFGASSLYLVLKVGMILNWQEELKQRVQR